MNIEKLIKKFNLTPHPNEGGFFIETYRSKENILRKDLPARYNGDRSFGTAIYYLLTSTTFSEIHRLKSDEIFHFYFGDPVEMINLFPDGKNYTPRKALQDGTRGELHECCQNDWSLARKVFVRDKTILWTKSSRINCY